MANPNDQIIGNVANAANASQTYDSTKPVRSTASATYTPTGLNDPNNLTAYNQRQEQQLNDMYDKNLASAQQRYKTAYDQNASTLQAERDKIDPQYQQAMSQQDAISQRDRRNNNIQAQANGLNTGAGSQMQLAASVSNQANMAAIERQKQQALDDANRRMSDLQISYQNQIAQAAADNDLERAKALYQEYQNAYNRQLQAENTNYERAQYAENQAYTRAFNEENRDYTRQFNEENRDYSRQQDEYQKQQAQAALLASYGDFSGYRDLYGYDSSATDYMSNLWMMQNPSLAYTLGKLSAEDYFKLTGQQPPDVAAAEAAASSGRRGGGGYYGGYYPDNGSSPDSVRTAYSPKDIYEANKKANVQGFTQSPSNDAQAAALLQEYNNRMARHYGT